MIKIVPIMSRPSLNRNVLAQKYGARHSVVGWGTMLQAGRSGVRVSMRWIIFNWPNPSSRTMALGSTQPLTEMSTRNLPGGKRRPACKASPPSMSRLSCKMWELRRLTTLRASTACYGNNCLPSSEICTLQIGRKRKQNCDFLENTSNDLN
jgi:hypothetical protein